MRPGETAPPIAPPERAASVGELPPALTDPPGVENLLAAVRRRWPTMLLYGVLAAGLAFAVVWFAVPGRYGSSVIFAITPKLDGTDTELASFARKQHVVLKNPQLLGELLTFSEVQELREVQDHAGDPVAWLQQSLVIDQPTQGAEALRVTLQGEYPDDLATVLSYLKRVYFKWHETNLDTQTKLREGQVADELKALDQRIGGKQKELVDLRVKLGMADQKGADLRLADLRDQRREHNSAVVREKGEQRRWQDELDRVQQQIADPKTIDIPYAEIDAQVRSDATLRQQQDDITKLTGQIQAAVKVAAMGENDATVRSLRAQLNGLENRHRQAVEQLRPSLEAAARARRLTELRRDERLATSSLERSKSAMAAAQEALKAVDQEINKLTGSAPGIDPAELLRLEHLNQDMVKMNDTRKILAAHLDRIKQEKASGIRVSVLQEPQVPKERTTDRKWKYGIVAALTGFFLAFLAVSVLEFRQRRVNSAGDVAQGLGLAVLGTLPRVADRDARPVAAADPAGLTDDQVALREAADGVRTVVLHASRQRPLHVLLVASAVNDEGKTTLATQLALSLARGGRRVLLVDADLRSPECHNLFDRPASPGVCEVLRGEVPVEDALQTTDQPTLFLLPAGRVDDKALQALAQDVPRMLFDELRGHFDFVVVDSSPLLPVSDTLQLAPYADGVVLAVLEQTSQLPAVHQAHQKLTQLGGPVLGAVVVGARQSRYGYGSRGRPVTPAREG